MNTYNLQGTSSVPGISSNSRFSGELQLLKLAEEYAKSPSNMSLVDIFPVIKEAERYVTIVRRKNSLPTLSPIVEIGKQDVVISRGGDAEETFAVSPIHLRETVLLHHGYMNNRAVPGTYNQRWTPEQQIDEAIAKMVEAQNLTWDVLRVMVLLGGINYTDSRTGAITRQLSYIPEHNFWDYKVTNGIKSRNDSRIFRSLDDSNSNLEVNAGVPWTDPNSDILMSFRQLSHYFMGTNNARITRIYMHPELMSVLAYNNQVKLSKGAIVLNAPIGASPVVPNGPDPLLNSEFTVSNEGLTSIAGVPIYPIFANYRDPQTGHPTTVIPKNKVIFVAEQNQNGVRQAPGMTKLVYSEANNGGEPGMWLAYNDQHMPPNAPGIHIQIGVSGMPFLMYPERVSNAVVSSIDEVNARLGVAPLYNYGIV